MEELKDGYLYKIDGKNTNLGIWVAAKRCFLISRFMFADNFLFEENHWDDNPPYGTVKPFRAIELSPFEGDYTDEAAVLDYLNVELIDAAELAGKKPEYLTLEVLELWKKERNERYKKNTKK